MNTQEFYENEFVCGKTTICRGDLESLPCPFCTKDVDDEKMQRLAELTEAGTRQRTSDYNESLMSKDKQDEIWWEELEDSCNYLGIPYYEDLDNVD